MAKRTSLSEKSNRPLDSLFNSIEGNENKETSKQENIQTEKQVNVEYTRQTYYLTKELIDALSVYATFEKIDKSEIVRNSLENYIPQKYKDMAKEIKEK